MPPTPSSASTDKKTGGKTRETSRPNAREREKEEEEKLANEFMASSLGRRLGITDEQFDAVVGPAPNNPDNPPCDGCKQPYAGEMQCGRCESTFYCGRDCQVAHWTSHHKAECKRLKERNEETAKRALESFKEVRDWTDLDVTGAYKAAVRLGLHDKIRQVMEQDKAEMVDHSQNPSRGPCICYTSYVMAVLFRGNRAEGNDHTCLSAMDGHRIRGYVRSHPDALEVWLQASVQLVRVITNPAMRREPLLQKAAHDAARVVWCGWSMVFISSAASRAILAPLHGGGGETAEQRRKRSEDYVRGIVTTLREAFLLMGGARASDPRLDPLWTTNSAVKTVVAMVLVRIQEYGIGIDVLGMLNLKGMEKTMFQNFDIPIAKRTIEKGGMLNMQETNAAFALLCRQLGVN